MITDYQKDLYNLHLKITMEVNQKPYTLRKNFTDFETKYETAYNSLLKLEQFLKIYKNLNLKMYFKAPYKIFKDKKFFDLEFYTTKGAVNTYNLYLNELKESSIDSIDSLEFIKNSLIFTKNFCVENNLQLNEYLEYHEIYIPNWMQHIYTYQISPYIILGFNEIGITVLPYIESLPKDEIEMYIYDFFTQYDILYDKLKKSNKAKNLIIEGLKIIQKKIIMEQNSQTFSIQDTVELNKTIE